MLSQDIANTSQLQMRSGDIPCSSCVAACPAGVDIPGYLAWIKNGDCKKAVETILAENPFVSSCAYICSHPCEQGCHRSELDGGLNIRGLKQFAVESTNRQPLLLPHRADATGKKIGIIGAGPAGMTAAWYLALSGHEIDVYEKEERPGGMLYYGVPEFRLPKGVLEEDLIRILSVGGIRVINQQAADPLQLAKSYDAVLIATGAANSRTPDIPGDAVCISALAFLRDINAGKRPDYHGKHLAVIGGGDVAADCARCVIRCGGDCTIFYRRRKKDMPASREEILDAEAEGVVIRELYRPEMIEGKNGRSTLFLRRMVPAGFSSSARPEYTASDASLIEEEFDGIISAVGQSAETLISDKKEQKSVFACGDYASGPSDVISAIASAKKAVEQINTFLGYPSVRLSRPETPGALPNGYQVLGRTYQKKTEASQRKNNFSDFTQIFTKEEAEKEVRRCMRCDVFNPEETEQ